MIKKITACLILMISLGACTSTADAGSLNSAASAEERNETEVEKANKNIIAKALGVFTWSSGVKSILSSLDTINAGRIQSAELTKENDDRYLDIVTEDDKRYRIYLSKNNNVEAVKDLDTGEWPVKSYR